MYLAIVGLLLGGFAYLNAIGAYIAAFAWVVICGLVTFVIAQVQTERWEKANGISRSH